MNYSYYVKTKDEICIQYPGHNADFVIQLRALRPSLEAAFPELNFTFACKQEHLPWMSDDPKTILIGTQAPSVYTIQIMYDAKKETHPIADLVSEIAVNKVRTKSGGNYSAVICQNGLFPTQSLTDDEVVWLCNVVERQGYKPITPKTTDIKSKQELARTAGMVAGVECDLLFEAVACGTPTILVPTGPGTELYRRLCDGYVMSQIKSPILTKCSTASARKIVANRKYLRS